MDCAELTVCLRMRGGMKRTDSVGDDDGDGKTKKTSKDLVQIFVRRRAEKERSSFSASSRRSFKFPSLKPQTVRFLSTQRRRIKDLVAKLRDGDTYRADRPHHRSPTPKMILDDKDAVAQFIRQGFKRYPCA